MLIYLAFNQPTLNLPASRSSASTVGDANYTPVSKAFPNYYILLRLSKYHFSVNCADFFFLFISFFLYLLAFLGICSIPIDQNIQQTRIAPCPEQGWPVELSVLMSMFCMCPTQGLPATCDYWALNQWLACLRNSIF